LTHTDRIIILLCLAVAVGLIISPRTIATSTEAKMVQIELGGRVLRQVRLLPSGQTKRIPIPLPQGKAVISLEKGGARILPLPAALCPQGICSHAGLISRSDQALVCAPNELVVRIIGARRRAVDAVAR